MYFDILQSNKIFSLSVKVEICIFAVVEIYEVQL
jgi:hypothetical protein